VESLSACGEGSALGSHRHSGEAGKQWQAVESNGKLSAPTQLGVLVLEVLEVETRARRGRGVRAEERFRLRIRLKRQDMWTDGATMRSRQTQWVRVRGLSPSASAPHYAGRLVRVGHALATEGDSRQPSP
jgi:hypothetical protein